MLNLTVTPKPAAVVTNEVICSGDSFTWAVNGQTYTVGGQFTVTNDGCTADQVLNLTVTPKPADIVTNEAICSGDSFTWVVNGQTYTVGGQFTVTNDGCTADQVLNLTVYTQTPDAITNASFCNGSSFVWSVNNQTYTTPGTFTEPQTDANGCPFNAVLNLSTLSVVPDVILNITICEGESYTWAVNNMTYTTGGTFTEALTDANGCTFNSILNLTVNPAPQGIALNNVTICDGTTYNLNDQSVAGQNCTWTDAQGNTLTNLNVGAGSYTYTCTSNGCSSSATLQVTSEDCCADFICAIGNVTEACNGVGGSATLFGIDGTEPYTYSWSDGQTTQTATNLAPGTYQTTITDALGCQSIDEVVISESAACAEPGISIIKRTNGIDIDSTDQPVIIIPPSGGVDVEWTYEVTNTGNVPLTNVLVTDNIEGVVCTIPTLAAGETQTCTLTGPGQLGMYENVGSVTGTPVLPDGSNGPIVNASDISSYIGVFINVEKSVDATCVCPGTEANFTLTIRLLGGGPGVQIGNISVADTHIPHILDLNSPEFVASSDVNGNGFIDFIDADGDGVSDEEFLFQYSLVIDETITNTAMDMGDVFFNGVMIGEAMNSSSVTVEASPACCACDLTTAVTGTDATCGSANGTVQVMTTGGLAPFVYNWSNGATTASVTGLIGGAYSVTVTDDMGCTSESSISIESAGGPTCSVSVEDATCGDADGMATATASGGVGVYSYNWSTGATTSAVFNLLPGSYSVTVTDDKGCQVVCTAVVGNDLAVCNAEIGDRVWHDLDNDGLQDFDEPGIPGATVTLFDAATGTAVATTTTDANGNYLFTNVEPGNYYIGFTLSSSFENFVSSPANVMEGGLDSDVSDANGLGTTDIFSVELNDVNLSIDAGYYMGATLGNTVWEDTENGIPNVLDGADLPVEGAVINLYIIDLMNGVETLVATTVTDANGNYLFTGLKADTYFVEMELGDDFNFVSSNAGGDDSMDSDVIEIMDGPIRRGRTPFVSLAAQEVNLDVDFGIVDKLLSVLAVEVYDFYGNWNESRSLTELFWTTDTEVNSDYFEVERSESLTLGYEVIGRTAAAGNSTSKLYYNLEDDQIFKSGTYYYRLKLVDLDGSFEYSDPITVTVEFDGTRDQEIALSVYPNPFLGSFTLDINVERESEMEGGLYDAIGQLIKNVDTQRIAAGNTQLTIDANDLPTGTYLLRVKVDEMVIFEKITKTN